MKDNRSSTAGQFGGVAVEVEAKRPALPGFIEAVSDAEGIRGWACDPDAPHLPISISARVGARIIGSTTADIERSDLQGFSHAGARGFLLPWAAFDKAVLTQLDSDELELNLEFLANRSLLPSSLEPLTARRLNTLLASRAENDSLQPPSMFAERLRETSLFDTDFYLERNPDVKEAGIDPLLHYLMAGEREGRQPSYYFNPIFYRRERGDAPAPTAPLLYDYLVHGGPARIPTSVHFDANWYASAYSLGLDAIPLQDYMRRKLERNPNPYFEVSSYLEKYPDLRGLSDPYMHFAEWGVREGRSASPKFHA